MGLEAADSLVAEHRDNLLGLKEKYLTDLKRIGEKVKEHVLTPFYRNYSFEHPYSQELKDSPFLGDVTVLVNAGCSLSELKLYMAYGVAQLDKRNHDAKSIGNQIKNFEKGRKLNKEYNKSKNRIMGAGKNEGLSAWTLNELFDLVVDTNKYVDEFKKIEAVVDSYLQSDTFKKIHPVSELYDKISAVDEKMLLLISAKQAA